MAKAEQSPTDDLGKLIKHIDSLESRLDNVDSIVSAVAERVMKQPITLYITCSHCGHRMEISVLGTEKPSK